jgi:hypothetical protein
MLLGQCLAVAACLALGVPATAGAAVSGRVLDPQGRPIAGAAVSGYAREDLLARADRLAAGRPREALARARSGADGGFRLDGNPAVAWVQAEAEGRAPAAAAARGAALTLTLPPAQPRRGTVHAGGRPVAGAVVVWSNGGLVEIVGRTGADGSYTIPVGEDGAALEVHHPDFALLQVWGALPHDLRVELRRGSAVAGRVVERDTGRPVAGATVRSERGWALAVTDASGAFQAAHAPPDWSTLTARHGSAVGVVRRAPMPLVIAITPARSVSGTVRDERGAPLAWVTVTALSTDELSRGALTDAAGRYTIEGLPSGRYRMHAGGEGLAPRHGERNGSLGPLLDLVRVASARHDVVLRRLPRVTGRVEDEAGRPVDGALVSLVSGLLGAVYAQQPFRGMKSSAVSERTGADGSFALTTRSVHEERRLLVLKPGYAAGRVELPAGAAPAPLVVRLSRGVELAGRLTGADGAPLAGVAVTLAEERDAPAWLPGGSPVAAEDGGWGTTDAAGRFSVRVHPVPHTLYLRKAGFVPRAVRGHDPRVPLELTLDAGASVRGRVVRADGTGVPGVRMTLASEERGFAANGTTADDGGFDLHGVAPGLYRLGAYDEERLILETRTVEAPAANVEIALAPRAAIRGRVVDAASRQPVARFEVWASLDEEQNRTRSASFDDPTGAFVLGDVPAGQVALRVNAHGYVPRHLDEITVTAEGDGLELEIALEPGVSVRGRITGEGGTPLPEAWVELALDGHEASARADEDGAYELQALPAGETQLVFQSEGFLPETRRVEARQGARVDVTLKRGLSLRGEVVQDGGPAPGVTVSAESSARDANRSGAQTDERGRFVLQALSPARYTVSAHGEDGASATVAEVDPARAAPLRLVLERPATSVVKGRVAGLAAIDQDGAVITVSATNEGARSAVALAAADGTFRINRAPVGQVTVTATLRHSSWAVSRSTRPVEIEVAAGAEAEVLLEFAGDIVVGGLVTRDGAPVPNATVSFTGPRGVTASGRTDARGSYEAVGLEPGSQQVTARDDVSSYHDAEHLVTASARLDIDMTPAALSGRVVRADGGGPLAGVEVSLFREDVPSRPAVVLTSNGQGAFSQPGLGEGRYRLITSKAGFGQEVRELDLARGATVELLLELAPAEGLGLSVVDARDGSALEAIVVVRDAGRRIVANRHSGEGADGALNIPLAAGSYLLSVSASGHGTVTMPVAAPRQGLRVALTPGGTLVIESARDLRGRVRLVQPDGEEYVRCLCNGIADIELTGRRTSVPNITPGSYTLELVDGAEGTAPRAVVIREGQTSRVAIE